MKHPAILAAAAALAVVLLAGCPSGPDVVPDAAKEAAIKAYEKAVGLMTRADDLGVVEALPDEYAKAREEFLQGKSVFDAAEWEKATKELDEASDLLRTLIDRAVVMLLRDRKKLAEDMREKAKLASASERSPNAWTGGETAYAAGSSAEGADKTEEAVLSYTRAASLFELAWRRCLATALRERIVKDDLARHDEENFKLAESKFALAEDASGTEGPGAIRAAIDAAEEAVLRYNLVLQKAAQVAADAGKISVEEAKTSSEGAKADIAAWAEYQAAVRLYEQALEAYAAGRFEDAARLFTEAIEAFQLAERVALEKKRKAEDALRAAEEAQAGVKK